MEELEIIVNGEKIKVDRFVSYGLDDHSIAIKGNNMYIKNNGKYIPFIVYYDKNILELKE